MLSVRGIIYSSVLLGALAIALITYLAEPGGHARAEGEQALAEPLPEWRQHLALVVDRGQAFVADFVPAGIQVEQEEITPEILKAKTDARLVEIVEEESGKLPVKAGTGVTLVNMHAADGKLSLYVSVARSKNRLSRDALKEMQPVLQAMYCNRGGFGELRELGVPATIVLSDKENRPVDRIFVQPEQCG